MDLHAGAGRWEGVQRGGKGRLGEQRSWLAQRGKVQGQSGAGVVQAWSLSRALVSPSPEDEWVAVKLGNALVRRTVEHFAH